MQRKRNPGVAVERVPPCDESASGRNTNVKRRAIQGIRGG